MDGSSSMEVLLWSNNVSLSNAGDQSLKIALHYYSLIWSEYKAENDRLLYQSLRDEYSSDHYADECEILRGQLYRALNRWFSGLSESDQYLVVGHSLEDIQLYSSVRHLFSPEMNAYRKMVL